MASCSPPTSGAVALLDAVDGTGVHVDRGHEDSDGSSVDNRKDVPADRVQCEQEQVEGQRHDVEDAPGPYRSHAVHCPLSLISRLSSLRLARSPSLWCTTMPRGVALEPGRFLQVTNLLQPRRLGHV